MLRVHATCIAIDGRGILLRGPSGSGKSDLALRLIDGGALLVADDQVILTEADGELTASAPATIAGRMEVRGIGVVDMPHLPQVGLTLVVDLVSAAEIERVPEAACCRLEGVDLPVIALAPFEPSARANLRLETGRAAGRGTVGA